MKNFFRSLRYLWPYRARLAAGVICAVFIGVLWGGGLAALLPGMKILLSPEGLHGWAYTAVSEDRLGVTIVRRVVPPGTTVRGQRVTLVLDLVRVDGDGAAAAAGIAANQWLVAVDGERFVRGDVLARELAAARPGNEVELGVYDPYAAARGEKAFRVVRAALGKEKLTSRMLNWAAGLVPEPQDRPGRMPILLGLLAIVAVVTILRDVLRFAQEYLVQSAVFRGLMDLRCENYGLVLRQPTTFFSEQGVTDSMSRFIQDSVVMSSGQITLFGKTLVEPLKAMGATAVALLLSWKLTLLTAAVGPPAYLLIRQFGRVMRRASRRALEAWSAMLAVLEETLTGIRVVKAYTMEGTEKRRFFRVNRRLLKQQRKMAAIDAATSPSVEALGIIAALAAVAVAGYWVLRGAMDTYVFLTWLACLAAMFDPVRKLAHVVTRFQRSEAAAARVFELHDREQEKHVAGAPTLARHSRTIEFEDVSYRYPSAADDALKHIRLMVRAGQTLAIVGPNGCGKTTLVSLVPRLMDPTEGQILIDGHDIAEVSVRSLRRQIGLVTQDTVLFNATIGENIAYGRRRAREEDVLSAAQRAYVDEFVRELPDGYDTMVGEHGATLSGGQKQRIAIARAILRDPAILIFDEATSQIDADSERRIHQAMEVLEKDRTTLLIAHRFATVLTADRIAVMSGGRIIDVGTHDELLGRCELYGHLYKTQFADTGG